jgi:hypothetical protein
MHSEFSSGTSERARERENKEIFEDDACARELLASERERERAVVVWDSGFVRSQTHLHGNLLSLCIALSVLGWLDEKREREMKTKSSSASTLYIHRVN